MLEKLIKPEVRDLFPLNSVDSVCSFFEKQILTDCEPNLALVSIILGWIENCLTSGKNEGGVGKISAKNEARSLKKRKVLKPNRVIVTESEDKKEKSGDFEPLEFEVVEALYLQFHSYIVSAVDWSVFENVEKSDEKSENCTRSDESARLPENISESLKTRVKSDENAEKNDEILERPEGNNEIPQKPEISKNLEKSDETFANFMKTTPELLRTVIHVVWNRLSKTYAAEKPHLQTLFTYLTGKFFRIPGQLVSYSSYS